MQRLFYDMLEANPVIAAVKDMEGLGQCCQTEEIRVVFILFGDLCSIGAIVEQVKAADKVAMVHMDLVQGLSSKEIAVDFIKQYTKADGIISTKPMMIKRAKELELYTVMRFFLLDSLFFLHQFLVSFSGYQPNLISERSQTLIRIILTE